MLGKITLLSTYGFPYESTAESWLGGLDASEEYLINLDNAVKIKVSGTTDSIVEYKVNLKDDSSPKFNFIVDETNAQLVTLAEATPASLMITLNVFEGALTFLDTSELDTVATRYNISDIVWGSQCAAYPGITRLVITEGGFIVKPIFVDHNIDQIVDLVDTGTTTTTSTSTSSTSSTSTSSTSTSSTSSTSTSSTSTSSTSTSSTSTSSTSSTSTSSTSSTSTSSTSTSTTTIA